MNWDTILRGLGIFGILVAYFVYTEQGASFQVYAFTVVSIGTVVAPEVVDQIPYGPDK